MRCEYPFSPLPLHNLLSKFNYQPKCLFVFGLDDKQCINSSCRDCMVGWDLLIFPGTSVIWNEHREIRMSWLIEAPRKAVHKQIVAA